MYHAVHGNGAGAKEHGEFMQRRCGDLTVSKIDDLMIQNKVIWVNYSDLTGLPSPANHWLGGIQPLFMA